MSEIRQPREPHTAQLPSQLTLTDSLSDQSVLQSERSTTGATDVSAAIFETANAIASGVCGSVAWSVSEKYLSNNKGAIFFKSAAACIAGGAMRTAVDGAAAQVAGTPERMCRGRSSWYQGAVDAMTSVVAFKAEKTFSRIWKRQLAQEAQLGVANDLLLEQGTKFLEGNLSARIMHNSLCGIVGGGAAGFAIAVPAAVEDHRHHIDTPEGLAKACSDVLISSAIGSVVGGSAGLAGTALLNMRHLIGYTGAFLSGKGNRFALDVHHFNDGHSALLGDGPTLSRLATRAEELKASAAAADRASVLLEMGDSHSGTIVDRVSQGGRLEGQLLNRVMKITASVPGNHAPDMLRPVRTSVENWVGNVNGLAAAGAFSGVAANIELPLVPGFTKGAFAPYRPYRIVEPCKGQKVALLGVVTDELQAATPILVDRDFIAVAARLGDRSWSEVRAEVVGNRLPQDVLVLVERVSSKKGFRELDQGDTRTVSSIVDALFLKETERHSSVEARRIHRQLIELARANPDVPLSEIAARNSDDSYVNELARLFPHKKITDLHEVTVRDPQAVLNTVVPELVSGGVNKIIVMSHLGKSCDIDLARKVPHISAIFGGHSHDLEPVSLWITNKSTKRAVPIAQAGYGYRWLGEANLVFDADGAVNRYLSHSRLHRIHGGIAPHPAVEEELQAYFNASPVGRELLEKVGKKLPCSLPCELAIDGIRGDRGKQTIYANVIVDALKARANEWLAGSPAAVTDLFGKQIDVALLHSGGIRGGISEGAVSLLEVENIPLNNMCIAKMSGSSIRKALNFGVHDFPESRSHVKSAMLAIKHSLRPCVAQNGQPVAALLERAYEAVVTEAHDPSGNFVLAGNLRYAIDRSRAPHQRVSEVFVREPESCWVPLDENKLYTVLTETHPIEKWGKVPMVTADRKRSASLDSLSDAAIWVHSAMVPDARTALANFSAALLPEDATTEALIAYFGRTDVQNALGALHSHTSRFRFNPITDRSAGLWRPSVYPTAATVVSQFVHYRQMATPPIPAPESTVANTPGCLKGRTPGDGRLKEHPSGLLNTNGGSRFFAYLY